MSSARAIRAYELARVRSGAAGAALAAGIAFVANAPLVIAALLVPVLALAGWRGGAWRRGALAGLLAGLPPLIVPHIVDALGRNPHCAECHMGPTLPCVLSCFATAGVFGALAGIRALRDPSPRRFASAAIATAALVGMLGCATTGMMGAVGVVIGLVAGGVTGWSLVIQRAR